MPEKLAQPKKKKPSDTMVTSEDKYITLKETQRRLQIAECSAKGGSFVKGKCER